MPAHNDDLREAGRDRMHVLRNAEHDRLRALRSERLARLRIDDRQTVAAPEPVADTALRDFLRALLPAEPAPGPVAATAPLSGAPAAAVLRFMRPGAAAPATATEPTSAPVADATADAAPPAPCDLDRLPGVGLGLIGALRRAGLCGLADVAALEAEELATRLGPVGRLVPAADWIAAARRAQAN
jgi:predicted flap endonuclease-1-like 5' DNA nuclease